MRRRALLDWLDLDRARAEPLQEQMAQQLRNAIMQGEMPSGMALPSSRSLAKDLGVSRGTVTAVYDRLLGESLLEVKGRSATFVSTVAAPMVVQRHPRTASPLEGSVQSRGEMPPPYPAFSPGMPAFDLFPAERWGRLLSSRYRQMTADLAGESIHIGGFAALRRALAEHLVVARGLICEPRQVLVTSSARGALSALCRMLAKPGDRCLVEDPGYFIVGEVVKGLGLEVVAIPVDGDGLVVEPFLPSAKMAYVTPTHQMPTGARLAESRARRLIEWARRENAWIIEDDYDSEFRYVGQPLVALQRSDPHGRVIYVGTFSKTLFPSLRTAFFVVPEDMVAAAERAVFMNGLEPPLHLQAALADFIDQGLYAKHIRKARLVYRHRQQLLVEALNQHMGDITRSAGPPGGMNMVLPLPAGVPAHLVQYEAARQSLHVRPLSFYAVRAPAPNALHLGFAAVQERHIEPAAKRLADIVKGLLPAR